MQIDIPKGKAQKEMEERLYIICKLFPELSEEEQKRIIDFLIFTHNTWEVIKMQNIATLFIYISIISMALCIAGYISDNSKTIDKLFRLFYKGEKQ